MSVCRNPRLHFAKNNQIHYFESKCEDLYGK